LEPAIIAEAKATGLRGMEGMEYELPIEVIRMSGTAMD